MRSARSLSRADQPAQLPHRCTGLAGLALTGLALTACNTAAPPSAPNAAQGAAQGAQEGVATSAEARAKQLVTRAWGYEPKVTPLLQRIAAEAGGRLVGLEHRLKSEGSTARKLKQMLAEDPTLSVGAVTIYDSLRYTLEVADEPKGNHLRGIKEALKQLEAAGYTVKAVKNYWPKGDNYSGVNTVISAADGFEWELQLHTPESVAESRRTHEQYERLRLPSTPPAERVALFEAMAAPWELIPVPEGILEEGALHPASRLRTLPRPSAAAPAE